MESKTLRKDKRHDHFWIQDEVLHESYHTIRGLRWRERIEVHGMPDEEICSPECIIYIEKNYL